MCCDVQYHRMSTYIIGCLHSTLQNFGVGESQSVYFCRESAPCGCLSSSLIFICKPEPSRPAEWNCNLLDQKSVSRNLARNIIMIYFKGQRGDSQPNCNMFFFFVFFVFILSPFWNAQLRSTSQEPMISSTETITFDLFFCLFFFHPHPPRSFATNHSAIFTIHPPKRRSLVKWFIKSTVVVFLSLWEEDRFVSTKNWERVESVSEFDTNKTITVFLLFVYTKSSVFAHQILVAIKRCL